MTHRKIVFRANIAFAALLCTSTLIARPSSADPGTKPEEALPGYDSQPIDWEVYKPLWLDNYQSLSPKEARRDAVDENLATKFLDETSRNWAAKNGCGTCHTNIPYLMTRPLITASPEGDTTMATVRKAMAESYKTNASSALRAFFAAPAAASVAVNDGLTTGKMSSEALELFDATWKLQHEDGNWQYPLDHMLPFLERERRYVAYLVALGVGYLPNDYVKQPQPQQGISRLMTFIRRNMPDKPHDQAVILWADAKLPDLLTDEEKTQYQQKLIGLQNEDGGWTLHALGKWPRHDGPENDANGPSDSYATGLAAVALCASGYDKQQPQVGRAVDWLEENQRVSGRWYTRSTYSDEFKGYVSNMATAYAMMALKICH